MAKNKFLKSLNIGNIGEEKFIELMVKNNINCTKGDGRSADVILGCGRIVEIKYDLFSARSGNIALEFFNSKLSKPSGITSTKSDFWVFVLPCNSVFISKTGKLREFFDSGVSKLRDVFGAGDDNADLRLYKKCDILDVVFTRIDDKDEEFIKNFFTGGTP